MREEKKNLVGENSIRIIIESKYFIYVLSIYSLIQFTVHLT